MKSMTEFEAELKLFLQKWDAEITIEESWRDKHVNNLYAHSPRFPACGICLGHSIGGNHGNDLR